MDELNPPFFKYMSFSDYAVNDTVSYHVNDGESISVLKSPEFDKDGTPRYDNPAVNYTDSTMLDYIVMGAYEQQSE